MSTVSIGKAAENLVGEYLKSRGFEVLDQNWRTRYCEIDIIAIEDECLYFVEVKYRKNTRHGDGLDYVTTTKQKQMAFAAAMWQSDNEWSGDACLAVAAVSGDSKMTVSQFIVLD